MTTREEMNSLKKTARIAGILILIISPFAIFSMMYVTSNLIVPGDAWATAKNIMASEGLFRLGMVSDSIVFLLEIVIVVMLYVLLKPVSKTLSLVAACSRLMLLSGADYLTVIETGQLNSLVLLFLNAQEFVTHIWGLFFSLHLFFLGYLVYKSGYIPRILGIVLVITSVCYLIQSWGNILLPKYDELFAWVGFISIIEVAFPIWLVIKGIRDRQPAARSAG
jgi:hypothetical protein